MTTLCLDLVRFRHKKHFGKDRALAKDTWFCCHKRGHFAACFPSCALWWGTQKFKDEETSKTHFWQKNVKSFYSGSYFLLKFLKHRWCTLKRSWPRRSGTNDIPQGFLTWFCSPAEKMLMLINCTRRSYNVQTFLHVVRISIFYYVFILFIRPPGCLTATSGFGIYEKSISFYTHEGYTGNVWLSYCGRSFIIAQMFKLFDFVFSHSWQHVIDGRVSWVTWPVVIAVMDHGAVTVLLFHEQLQGAAVKSPTERAL